MTTIYDFARARGVHLEGPRDVEAFVNSLPGDERQEALILVLASPQGVTPGHVYPQPEVDLVVTPFTSAGQTSSK